MSGTDSDLVARMAKKHSVSPAAVGVVLTALRHGGGRMAQFSHADFGGMSQWSATCSTRSSMPNSTRCAATRGVSRRVAGFGRRAIGRGRSQPPFGVGISRLVAGGIGQAWRGGFSERPPVLGFSRDAPIGHRRPRCNDGLRHGLASDFRRHAGPKQRPNPFVRKPGRIGQGFRPSA
jgi:hypothetical protein